MDTDLALRPTKADAALLIVRLAVGIAFIIHGAELAFGAFGGPGLQGFSGFSHLPLPVAALIAYGEFLGGLGVLFGVLSRIASVGLALIMLGAIFIVHLKNGFDVTKGGFEYAFVQFLLCAALVVAGPGAYTALRLLRGSSLAAKPQSTPILQ